MLKPPFKLATSMTVAAGGLGGTIGHASVGCCEPADDSEESAPAARMRLADMDPHLHCSVIGTCLSTAELRKLMARFLFVRDSSDLEVHHEAVAHASRSSPVAKALQKLLDQRHETVIQRFARERSPQALCGLWEEALKQGEIPGAYWAVLTHRNVTPELRQRVFGDVHMLSHLVGAANRADIRRLVALERDNAELRDRVERQQARTQELIDERDRRLLQLEQDLSEAVRGRSAALCAADAATPARALRDELQEAAAMVAVQTQRRERAEQAAAAAADESQRLREELEHLARHAQALGRELVAAETQLREAADGVATPDGALDRKLRGRRILYVGGRPSSTPAIRDLVLRHGGEFQHHDGGLEDRKGLLASSVAWAHVVVFPVDCIDHDSAGSLKRLCARHGIPFLALRSASVASFAAAMSTAVDAPDGQADSATRVCLKHG